MSGFQCFNDRGTIQLDSENSNFGCVWAGTITTGDISDPTYGGSWSIALADNLPTYDSYAVSCTSGAVVPGVVGFDDQNSILINAVGGSHQVKLYLFRQFIKLPRSAHGVGIEVVNAANQVTYSTAYRPLAIVAQHPVTNMYQGMSEGRGLPGGRVYAFMQYGTSRRAFRSLAGSSGGDIGDVSPNGAGIGCRTVNGGYVIEEIRGNCFSDGLQCSGGILAVDVTGVTTGNQ